MAVVAATAIATFLLGPFVTHTWQNHDRELDIESHVVGEMSAASGSLIVAVLEREFHPGYELPKAYVTDFRTWDVQRRNVALELQTYFNGGLAQAWLDYGRILLDYNLEGLTNTQARQTQLHLIEEYIGGGARYPDLYPRLSPSDRDTDRTYQASWRRLEDDLIHARSVIAQRVLDTSSRL